MQLCHYVVKNDGWDEPFTGTPLTVTACQSVYSGRAFPTARFTVGAPLASPAWNLPALFVVFDILVTRAGALF